MKKRLKTMQGYPFISSIFSLLLVGYLFSLVLRKEYGFIDDFYNSILSSYSFLVTIQFTFAIVAIFVLILAWEFLRFYRVRKVVKHNSNRLRKEIEDLWESKKYLQNKAHTYSGHADKLKLFISDKLLEYIEYDEKFLHFKSIAAEVRHNGVISYDIVTTLLERLVVQGAENNSSNDQDALYALESIRYLWDLLDLSTADNIALHIANQLINAEEQYYQMMLEKENMGQVEVNTLLSADFSSSQAVISTLMHLVHEPKEMKAASTTFFDEASMKSSQLRWQFHDDQFNIQLNVNKALLGNANHVRLMLENLFKNAQHFSRKVPFKQKSDRIIFITQEDVGCIEFQLYNRGPQVLEENKKKLFQLGYSTRRTKGHQGKGLGLFFVNEIVKGYEGQLLLENIDNKADSYSIRIALKNGRVETNIVNVEVLDQRPCITAGNDNEAEENHQSSVRWQYTEAIESIEISSNSMQDTYRFSSDGGVYEKSESYLQESEFTRIGIVPPCWRLDVQAKRGGNKTHNIIFNVLDISGVRFSIKLPTAESRLESIQPSWLE
jgi:signal transduction histidine kinase